MKKIYLLLTAFLAIASVQFDLATAQSTVPKRQIQWNYKSRETRLSFVDGEFITDAKARQILGQEGYNQLQTGLAMHKCANVFSDVLWIGGTAGIVFGILWACDQWWAMYPTIACGAAVGIGFIGTIVFACIRNPIYRDIVTKYNTGQLAFDGNGEMMLTHKPTLRIGMANHGMGIALKF